MIIQFGVCSHSGSSGRSANVILPTSFDTIAKIIANRVSTDSSASCNVTGFIRLANGQSNFNTRFTCVFSEGNCTAFWIAIGH